MGFRNRLALFLVVTLVSVQALAAIFVYRFVRDNLIDKGKEELTTATDVFMRQLTALSERVSDNIEILALDYPLRQAIAQQNEETARSALRNHGRRAGATRMLLVGLDGIITADTAQAKFSGNTFPFSGLLDDAAADGRGMALATVDGLAYWIVVVPVNAPVLIAYIVAAVPVDDALVESLRQLTALPERIALATVGNDGSLTVVAQSALHPPAVQSLSGDTPFNEDTVLTSDDGTEYLTRMAPLAVAEHSQPVIAIFDYPLQEALEPYQVVIRAMLIAFGVALAVAICGTTLIARGVSRPLEGLAVTARRIETGDYTPPAEVRHKDELGHLSSAISRMVTAIREREAALEAAVGEREIARDEAVRANLAKSQFLANMSHELRTPLNAIIGFGESIHEQILGPVVNSRYLEYAGHILDSGKHLLALVEEMLDLAKIEAGALKIDRNPTHAGNVLLASLAMLRGMIEKADIELDVKCDPAAWPSLAGDALKLKQMFINLLGNAVKFTPPGGRITVSGEVTTTALVVRIADTGIGMRPEDIPLVVRPFHRLNSALDSKYQGAGLGLPFAKAVAELHGGSLIIDSRLGFGTIVTVTLPFGTSEATESMDHAA